MKRILSFFLSLMLVMTLLPLHVFAANDQITIKGTLVYKIKDSGDSWWESEHNLTNAEFDLCYTKNSSVSSVILTTDSQGRFSVTVDGPITGAYVRVNAINKACYVVPNVDGNDALNNENIYSYQSPTKQYKKGNTLDMGKITVTPGGAFHIMQTIKRGYEDWSSAYGSAPPQAAVKWSSGVGTGSFMNNQKGSGAFVSISGGTGDPDEYDESVILHEYGHFIMRQYAAGAMQGGTHYLNGSADTRLTFSEGWATYFGQSTLGESTYEDSKPGVWNDLTVDLENPTNATPKDISNENWNAAAMWDISDDKGNIFHENWDQLDKDFSTVANAMVQTVSSSQVDSGIMTVTVQDFYEKYADNNFTPNSEDMYNYWKIFEKNGMQFDSELPTINVSAKNLGDISTVTTVSATVSDNVKVKQVQFIVDGKTKKTVKNPDGTVSYDIDPAKFSKGKHSLQIRAYDFAGNYYTSALGAINGTKQGWFKTGDQLSASFGPSEDVVDQDPEFTNRIQDSEGMIENVFDEIISWFSVLPRDEYNSQTIYFSVGEDTAASKFATSNIEFDDIGAIINDMGFDCDVIPDFELNDIGRLKQYDAIFLNCNSSADSYCDSAAEAIRQYVEDGGTLYASDWAYAYIQSAFPDAITFSTNPKSGNSQYGIVADVKDMGLSTTLGSSTIEINMDLGSWVVMDSVPETTTVYVAGEVSTYEGNKYVPLLVSFKVGSGKVFYTSFHNEAQATDDMDAVLNYLVLNMENSSNEDTLNDIFINDNYSYNGSTFGQLSAGGISSLYSLSCEQGYEYSVMIDRSLGDFSLTVIDPDGKEYKMGGITLAKMGGTTPEVDVVQSGFIIRNASGEWTYYVEAGFDVPENSTFLVGTGMKPQEPVLNGAGKSDTLLFNSSTIHLSGSALADSYVYAVLKDTQYVVIDRQDQPAENGVFELSMPSLSDGIYYLTLTSSDGMNESWSKRYTLTIDTFVPEIVLGEDYESYIFGEKAVIVGTAVNATSVTIHVNGISIPVQYVNSNGELVYSVEATLNNGDNTVEITAFNDFGVRTTKEFTIQADLITDSSQRTQPRITAVTGVENAVISENTTVLVAVENGNIDDTKLNVSMNGEDLTEVGVYGPDGFAFAIQPAIVGAGEKALTVTARNKWGKMDTCSFTVNVLGSAPSISVNTPQDMEISQNSKAELSLNSIFESVEELQYDCNYGEISDGKWIFTPTDIGEYVVMIGAHSASGDDVISMFTVVVTEQMSFPPGNNGGDYSSGDSSNSDPTYSITLPSRVTGGAVKVTPTSASERQRVTITVKPNTGYELDILTATDSRGNTLTLTDQGDGKYTFIMPNSKVSIDVSFKAITSSTHVVPINFTDVQPSAYYYDAVVWAVENGITFGITDTTFGPDMVCTRAQIVSFLWRAAGSPKMNADNPFTDVSANDYYYDSVLWAVEQGITFGTTSTTFNPNSICTRAQAVSFLYRAQKSPVISGTNSFADLAPGAYYTDAVQWAVDNSVTAGTTATTFSPEQDCTRAQIVTFLYRDRAN